MQNSTVRPDVAHDLSNLLHDAALWEQVMEYDMSIITKTFAERQPKYAAQANELEYECKRFMYLACIAPNLDLAPTKPIDEYWHQFMLFTHEYQDFCNKFNGYFVHHNPLAGPDHKTIFERTQDIVTKVFGAFKNKSLWFLPMPATSCKCTNAPVRIMHA